MAVDATLKQRHGVHGDYHTQSIISMNLARVMRQATGYYRLSSPQEEALLLIAVKIGRILAGDPNAADHWHDIAGYATLVENLANGKQANGVVPATDKIGNVQECAQKAQYAASEEKPRPSAGYQYAGQKHTGESTGDPVRGAWGSTISGV